MSWFRNVKNCLSLNTVGLVLLKQARHGSRLSACQRLKRYLGNGLASPHYWSLCLFFLLETVLHATVSGGLWLLFILFLRVSVGLLSNQSRVLARFVTRLWIELRDFTHWLACLHYRGFCILFSLYSVLLTIIRSLSWEWRLLLLWTYVWLFKKRTFRSMFLLRI